MTTEPEALRLADALQAEFPGYEVSDVSAAELRRLHAQSLADEALLREAMEALGRLQACYSVSHPPAVRQSCWEQVLTTLSRLRQRLGE